MSLPMGLDVLARRPCRVVQNRLLTGLMEILLRPPEELIWLHIHQQRPRTAAAGATEEKRATGAPPNLELWSSAPKPTGLLQNRRNVRLLAQRLRLLGASLITSGSPQLFHVNFRHLKIKGSLILRPRPPSRDPPWTSTSVRTFPARIHHQLLEARSGRSPHCW